MKSIKDKLQSFLSRYLLKGIDTDRCTNDSLRVTITSRSVTLDLDSLLTNQKVTDMMNDIKKNYLKDEN